MIRFLRDWIGDFQGDRTAALVLIFIAGLVFFSVATITSAFANSVTSSYVGQDLFAEVVDKDSAVSCLPPAGTTSGGWCYERYKTRICSREYDFCEWSNNVIFYQNTAIGDKLSAEVRRGGVTRNLYFGPEMLNINILVK